MSYLRNIWTDLIERKLWPAALLLLGLAVVVPVAITAGGGSSSTSGSTAKVSLPAPVAVSEAQANPNAALAETVNGASVQRDGRARDPFFVPKVAATTSGAGVTGSATTAKAATTTASATTAPVSTPNTDTTTSSTTTSKSTTTPSTAPAPTTLGITYHVDVQFGPAGQARLYRRLVRLQPLPSRTTPIVAFVGVKDNGKVVTFAPLAPAFIGGSGVCAPSPLKCQLMDLKVGETESFEVDTASDTLKAYTLKIDGVGKHHTTALVAGQVSREGRAMLQHLSLPALDGFAFSPTTGTLVSAREGGGNTLSVFGLASDVSPASH
ncbi:MAG TPA: hypothetical protein VHX88_11865 [Solirubrobacteraceae bacterium]|jgi:hypothetical protein|nr:hypothetical protein [Solirubrobacteraceae bacterium]